MVKLKWTDQAITDLDEIAEYIARDSVKYAKIQVKRIDVLTVHHSARLFYEDDFQ